MSLEIPVCDFEPKIDVECESDVHVGWTGCRLYLFKILMSEQADYGNVGLKTLIQHYGREKNLA